jgi:hypothetical protein
MMKQLNPIIKKKKLKTRKRFETLSNPTKVKKRVAKWQGKTIEVDNSKKIF